MEKCPRCGKILESAAANCCPSEPELQPERATPKRNVLYRILFFQPSCSLVLLFAAYFFLVVGPNFLLKHSNYNKTVSCHANIRALKGAVEMYNLDHSTRMKTLDIDRLLSESYWKDPGVKECPGWEITFWGVFTPRGIWVPWETRIPGGTYSGENLDSTGTIQCSMHKSPE